MKTNSATLIGNLGTDVESRQTNNGNNYSKFSLATSESYKNKKGEKTTDTTWHNIVCWGKTAELAEKYLKKGNKVGVEGKIANRSYQDNEGTTRYVSEVVVNSILMFGNKASDQQTNAPESQQEEDSDDLPF